MGGMKQARPICEFDFRSPSLCRSFLQLVVLSVDNRVHSEVLRIADGSWRSGVPVVIESAAFSELFLVGMSLKSAVKHSVPASKRAVAPWSYSRRDDDDDPILTLASSRDHGAVD